MLSRWDRNSLFENSNSIYEAVPSDPGNTLEIIWSCEVPV
jgi:hypothetical protein